MNSEIIILALAAFAVSLHAERNIIPSPAVCATFPNEEFAIDVSRCQNTCQFYGRIIDCPNYYKPFGDCYCKRGFARLVEDGKCVSVKNNAVCVGRLPISKASCNKPNEEFRSHVKLGDCDISCRTYGCRYTYDTYDITPYVQQYKWAPHCTCAEFHRRLSNGNCVHVSDPQCVAEYQPSTERCNAIGQIYSNNVPCQSTCFPHVLSYCPVGPACICPSPERIANILEMKSYTLVGNGDFIQHPSFLMISCVYEKQCRLEVTTTAAPISTT